MSRPALWLEHEGDPELAALCARALAHQGPVRRYTHGFHTYPAGLHPDAARDLVGAFPGRVVRDPFCGGGTVLVEAAVAGRQAVGADISPVARLVARARTAVTDEATRTGVRSAARRMTAAARGATEPPPEALQVRLSPWYEPHVLVELGALHRGLSETSGLVRDLLTAVFSSIVVKTSHRRSDTSRRREVAHRPPGTTAVLFHKKARELARRLETFSEAVPEGTPGPVVLKGDARRDPSGPRADLIVTSPPYPGTYDYLPMQELREIWLGWRSPAALEIGPRRHWRGKDEEARAAWIKASRAWMRSSHQGAAPGAHLVVVVGDGHDDLGRIDTWQTTRSLAEAVGWRFLAGATAGRRDVGREHVLGEHVLVFARAGADDRP